MKNNEDVIKNLDNAWIALCRQYNNSPDEATRISLNMLSKIIRKVKDKLKSESITEKQISIEEWIAWFKE